MKQVLAARGAGIVTSVVVSNIVEEMAKEHNIKVDTKQIEITETGPCEDIAGLLVTTVMAKKGHKFSVINTRNFLTGTDIEETKQQTLTELQK